jgi:hypothetical protein
VSQASRTRALHEARVDSVSEGAPDAGVPRRNKGKERMRPPTPPPLGESSGSKDQLRRLIRPGSGTSTSTDGPGKPEDPGERQAELVRNRALWESTLPPATEALDQHVRTGYDYDYIDHGPSSKRVLIGKSEQPKKETLLDKAKRTLSF